MSSVKYTITADVSDFEKKINGLRRQYKSTLDDIASLNKLALTNTEASTQETRERGTLTRGTDEYKASMQRSKALREEATSLRNTKKEYMAKQALITSLIAVEKNNIATTLRQTKALNEEALAIKKSRKATIAAIRSTLDRVRAEKTLSAWSIRNAKTTNNVTTSIKSQTTAQKALSSQTSLTTNGVVRLIRQYESLLVGVYAITKGYQSTLGVGHEYNKLLENEISGLKILAVQNLKNEDTLGRKVTLAQKYNAAQKESVAMLKLIKKINPETPYNLGDTIKTYKSLFPQLIKYKASLEDIAEVTKKMTILGKAMNLDTGQFIKTVDTAFSGAMKPSQMQLALNQVGITNTLVKEWQKSGTLIDNILSRLSGIDSELSGITQNFDTLASNFATQWQDLWGEIQKPIFVEFKKDISSATDVIKENKAAFIGVSKDIGHTIAILAKVGTAYYGVKVAIGAYNKLLLINSARIKAVTLSQISSIKWSNTASNAYTLNAARVSTMGIASVATAGMVTRLGYSLKALVMTNPILLAITAAMVTYEFATAGAREEQEKLKDALDDTILEMAKFDKVEIEVKTDTLNEAIKESKDEIETLKKALGEISKNGRLGLTDTIDSHKNALKSIGFWNSVLDKEKEQLALVHKKIREKEDILSVQEEQLINLKSITTEQKEQALITKNIKQAILEEKQHYLDLTVQYRELRQEALNRGEILKKVPPLLQEQLNKSKKNTRELGISLDKSEKLENKFANIANIEYGNISNIAGDIANATVQASQLAYTLANIKSDYALGSISEEESLSKIYDAKVANALKLEDITKRDTKLITLKTEYTKNLASIKKKASDDELRSKKTLLSLDQQIASASGDKQGAYDAEIRSINLLVDSEVKLKKLKLAKLNYEKSKKSGKGSTGYSRKNNSAKSVAKDWEKSLKDVGKQAKKMTDEMNKDIEDSAKRFSDNMKSGIESIFSGDIRGGIDSMLSDSMTSISDSITSTFNSSALGGIFSGIFSGIVSMGLDMLFAGSHVSKAEIEASKGRTDYTDESLKNAIDIFETAQYPMLEVTNKMYKHIRNMDENFYAIARAFSSQASTNGIDLTGVNFVDTLTEGFLGFSSKSISLIGTGLQFAVQNLEEVMSSATLRVRAYTTTLVEESSFWGWDNDSHIDEVYKGLPRSIKHDIASSFALGYETLMTAGVTLGLDKADLSTALKAADVNLGKIGLTGLSPDEINERLSQVFSTAFSGVIGQISGFTPLINRYTQATDDALETLTRIAVEYDQASFSFKLIGKTFTDTILLTLVESELVGSRLIRGRLVREAYSAQMQILDIVKSTGGLTEFQDAMGSFMDGFYTDAEQLEFMTKSMATSFDTLKISMPSTNAEFRSLLETMDTSTEEGSYLYGQVLLLADGFNTMTKATQNLGTSIKDMIANVSDAWLGNLSYLTAQQKTDYASGYLAIASSSKGEIDTVEAARLAAETALRTTATKEEYIPTFERYISEMENQVSDATNTDLLNELKELKEEVVELRTSTIDAYIHTRATA